MPIIYLSPSLQEYNQYLSGGNEEYYMNLVADAMVPYLRASGIQFVRNRPSMTLREVINESNAGSFDLHLALHSNAAPEHLSGQLRGVDAYYAPKSYWGRRFAEILVRNFKEIYPLPDRVQARATNRLGEVLQTRAPAVLLEIGYHDNAEDEAWLKENIPLIARTIVLSLTQYFGIPFVEPQPIRMGTVSTNGSNLNLRSKPSLNAPIIASMPNGTQLLVFSENDGWCVVQYGDKEGYASSQYIVF